jgi:molecular chaperone GrpE
MTSDDPRGASAATPDDASGRGAGSGWSDPAPPTDGSETVAGRDPSITPGDPLSDAARAAQGDTGHADAAHDEDATAGPGRSGLGQEIDDFDTVEDVEPEVSDVVEDDPMAVLMRERDDYKDALVRLQADFENYKKRMIKQQTDHLERAAETLVGKLLPVLDTADLALAHGGGEDVKQISAALSSVLEREGLERIDPNGGPFDPTLHDAVAHEPGDGDQQVVDVLRAGYRWKGRVLRPAMVKVRG